MDDSGNYTYKNGEIVEVVRVTDTLIYAKAKNRIDQCFDSREIEPFADFQQPEPRDGMDMVTAFAKLLLHDRDLLARLVWQVEEACGDAREMMAELLAMSDFCINEIPYFESIDAIWSDRMTASEEKMFLERLERQPYREAIKKELGKGYIPAIKLCRQMTGWDLKRAREFINQMKGKA